MKTLEDKDAEYRLNELKLRQVLIKKSIEEDKLKERRNIKAEAAGEEATSVIAATDCVGEMEKEKKEDSGKKISSIEAQDLIGWAAEPASPPKAVCSGVPTESPSVLALVRGMYSCISSGKDSLT